MGLDILAEKKKIKIKKERNLNPVGEEERRKFKRTNPKTMGNKCGEEDLPRWSW